MRLRAKRGKANQALTLLPIEDLIKRVYQHKNNSIPGFSDRYDCKLLVYYEIHEEMLSAIAREKQIKGGSRKKKLALIEGINPKWLDLYDGLL